MQHITWFQICNSVTTLFISFLIGVKPISTDNKYSSMWHASTEVSVNCACCVQAYHMWMLSQQSQHMWQVLECGLGCSDEGLGLVNTRVEGENLLQPGALFVSTQGDVTFHVDSYKTTGWHTNNAVVRHLLLVWAEGLDVIVHVFNGFPCSIQAHTGTMKIDSGCCLNTGSNSKSLWFDTIVVLK